jgi:hypothetical protein
VQQALQKYNAADEVQMKHVAFCPHRFPFWPGTSGISGIAPSN